MRKIVLALAVSLDGYIEGPNGEYDWCFTDQDYGMSEFMKRIDALFMGRKSYELTQKQSAEMIEGADMFSHLRQYVFSNTLSELPAPFELVSGDINAKVDAIKSEEGKDIWLFGGASLTTAMFNHNLVDEIWMAVHPLILGDGKLLFNDIKGRRPLKLIDSKTYSTGLVSLVYEVAKPK